MELNVSQGSIEFLLYFRERPTKLCRRAIARRTHKIVHTNKVPFKYLVRFLAGVHEQLEAKEFTSSGLEAQKSFVGGSQILSRAGLSTQTRLSTVPGHEFLMS